jgi:hypothetical protein
MLIKSVRPEQKFGAGAATSWGSGSIKMSGLRLRHCWNFKDPSKYCSHFLEAINNKRIIKQYRWNKCQLKKANFAKLFVNLAGGEPDSFNYSGTVKRCGSDPFSDTFTVFKIKISSITNNTFNIVPKRHFK